MLLVHGLRLLVALITFAVGVGAGRLFGSEGRPCGKRVYTSAPVGVAATSVDVPRPPSLENIHTTLDRCRRGQISLDAHELFGGGRNSQGTPMVYAGSLQSKALSKPAPAYPAEARAARIDGVVKVQIVVGEDGSVRSARAVSGPELMRAVSVDAACRSRFTPTLISDRPVPVAGVVSYNFVLQ